ncbi:MAG: hypothetical protein ACI8Z1_002336 [Candidatus Azotimanducaceae bacterium]|jgi:uncharacterized protein (DUF58 family)
MQTATLICGAIGLDTDLSLVYQLFALMLCLLIFSRFSLKFQIPEVSCRRRLPRYATADEPFKYRVTVTNDGSRIEKDLRILDNPKVIPPDRAQFRNMREPFEETRNAYDRWIGFHRFVYLQGLNTGITVKTADVPDVDRMGQAEVIIDAMPLRRGNVQFESISLLHPDPMGLNFGIIDFPERDHLTVLPKRYPVSDKLLFNRGRNFQPGGVNATWSIGESDEFASLRDYRDGDPIRKIHWASTAKRNKPVVKEFQDEFFVRQGLVVDNSTEAPQQASASPYANPVFEAQIIVAASLLTAIPLGDGLMDLFTLGEHAEVCTAGRGFGDCATQLEILAKLNRADSEVEQLIRLLTDRARQLSGCLFVLGSYTPSQQRLVSAIETQGVETRIFITEDKAKRSSNAIDYPAGALIIDPSNIEEALASL